MELLDMTSFYTPSDNCSDVNFSTCAHVIYSDDTPTELPKELREINNTSIFFILMYCILFITATSGNLKVLQLVLKQYKRSKSSRILLLVLNLAVADLIVCCTVIPTEIFWRITIQWLGGNVLCKMCQFMRAFGLYLSSLVLICLSFDRFFAIFFPMGMLKQQGHYISKIMLRIAWIAAATFSAPQAVFFSVESHPQFPSFKQCVTNEFLKTSEDVKIYSIFSVTAMYFTPLIVILFTYTAIILKIIHEARHHREIPTGDIERSSQRRRFSSTRQCRLLVRSESSLILNPSRRPSTSPRLLTQTGPRPSAGSVVQLEYSLANLEIECNQSASANICQETAIHVEIETTFQNSPPTNPRHRLILRRSDNAASQLSRARNRTLMMTLIIVSLFAISWTPYAVITLWYMFDWESAQEVDPRVQEGLFAMAVANSCVNPLIYGSFTRNPGWLCSMSTWMRTGSRGHRHGSRKRASVPHEM